MSLWDVPVRNAWNNEVRTVRIEASCEEEAQVNALHQVFYSPEWPGQKYTALRAREVDVAA